MPEPLVSPSDAASAPELRPPERRKRRRRTSETVEGSHLHTKRKREKLDPKILSARIASVLLYGTFGLLMFGPLAFGSVEPWSIFLLEAGALTLTLLWLAKQSLDGEIVIQSSPLFLPMAAFGGKRGLD